MIYTTDSIEKNTTLQMIIGVSALSRWLFDIYDIHMWFLVLQISNFLWKIFDAFDIGMEG